MSQEAVERFLGRLITDESFRDMVMNNFSNVCSKYGFEFTAEEKKIVQKIDLDRFCVLADRVDKGIKRTKRSLKAVTIN